MLHGVARSPTTLFKLFKSLDAAHVWELLPLQDHQGLSQVT